MIDETTMATPRVKNTFRLRPRKPETVAWHASLECREMYERDPDGCGELIAKRIADEKRAENFRPRVDNDEMP